MPQKSTKTQSKPKTRAKAKTKIPVKKLKDPRISVTQKEAAYELGITARALREWQKEPGFPNWESGYDIPAIKLWAEGRNKKNSEYDQIHVDLEEKIKRQKLRKETLQADKLAREAEEATGNILRRDEWETFAREQITIARDRMSLIPRNLCRHVPQKYHETIQAEGEKELNKVFDEIAKAFKEGIES